MRQDPYPIGLWVWWTLALPLALLAIGVVVFLFADAQSTPLDNPRLWWMLGIAPLAGAIFLYGRRRRQRSLQQFVSEELCGLLSSRMDPRRPPLRSGLMVLAMALIAAAILGPRWGMSLDRQRVRGIDLAIAFDVSRSMLANDLAPNRLSRAKQIIKEQFLDRPTLGGRGRMGLIAFAGSTSLKTPLTTDLLSLRSKLDALNVGSAPRGGTAIGKAIYSAADMFVRSPEGATKAIVIFTDGEDHEEKGAAIEAATQVYKEHGVIVYTIGVGDPSKLGGAQVPSSDAVGAPPLVHDGQIVFSRVDTAGLREIAQSGGGDYEDVEQTHRIVSDLANLKSAELSMEERARHTPRYQWFVASALALLALELLLGERRKSEVGLSRRVWQQEAMV